MEEKTKTPEGYIEVRALIGFEKTYGEDDLVARIVEANEHWQDEEDVEWSAEPERYVFFIPKPEKIHKNPISTFILEDGKIKPFREEGKNPVSSFFDKPLK